MNDVATPTAPALTRLREAVDGLIEAVESGGLEQLHVAEKVALWRIESRLTAETGAQLSAILAR